MSYYQYHANIDLRLSIKTNERFYCYKDNIIVTLTSGTKFNLYCDDEEIIVAGSIEHHSTHGYYFVDDNGYVMHLYSGLKGTLS